MLIKKKGTKADSAEKKPKLLESPKKKKDLVIDVSPKKKKRELALVEEDDEPKISKLGKKTKLKTIFGSKSEKILRMLETDDTDPAVALIYKHLLQTLVDTLPLAELGVRKSKGARGVYQLNQMVSSVRELLVDIQSAQDRGMMGTTLVENIVKPMFSDIAQAMVEEYNMVGSDAKLNMTDEEYAKFRPLLLESRTRLANKMNHSFRDGRDQIINFLQR